MSQRFDLGHDHILRFLSWAPDDLPANRERYGYPLPNIERVGCIVSHPAKQGEGTKGDGSCESAIHFNLAAFLEHNPGYVGHVWEVQSWEPLTVSPSLLFRICGDHGFIREGKWIPA